jgi:FKBP-type peptidyl-prolyl cis-trans isomerase 2/regulation of enolase protein 1 (concanavalin A-like superfamily)
LLSGTFTQLPISGNGAPTAGVGTMEILTDGTVMVHGGGIENGGPGGVTNTWYRLTPSSTGSYLNGTWSQLADMTYERVDYATEVLPSGEVMIQGGEVSNDYRYMPPQGGNPGDDTPSGEIYNPLTNTWTNIATFTPIGTSSYDNFGDDPTELLPSGNVLGGYIFGPQTYLYNPNTNTWSQTGTKVASDRSDEEGWVLLPGGNVLSYDVFAPPVNGMWQAQYYNSSQGTWHATGGVPVPLSQASFTYPDGKVASDYELGPPLLIPDGRVFFLGANGNTAYYTPSTNSWTAGPVIPDSLVCDDAPAAELPDGNILFAADSALYEGPTHIFEFNPTTNTYTDLSSELPTSFLNYGLDPARGVGPGGETVWYSFPSYAYNMVVLPTGQVMIANTFSDTIYVFTDQPGTPPAPSAVPTISSIAPTGGGSYLLTGTGLNGISEGASYGDDAGMSSNFPIVQLTDPSGNVYYARTYNWTPGVATASAQVTTDFALPAGLPANTYMVSVIANGVASAPVSRALAGSGTDPAPTVPIPAAAAPSPVTGTTASLSVLGSDTLSESTLTYTWTATAIPGGAAGPAFAVNGTNAAKNDTVTFFAAGTYTFQVTLINQAGLSTSSSVTVVVAPTLSAITVSPAWLSANQNATQQLSATALDQFGASLIPQPSFTWTVTAGGGSVSPSGLYTAPGSGTLATVSAAAGPVIGSASVYVLSSPWSTQDVGAVTVSGAAGDNGNGTFVVLGSGSGIGSTADGFRFAYQTLSGDGSITAHLSSQVITGSSGLAGLMIRNDLSAGAAMAFMGIFAGGGGDFEIRATTGGAAGNTTGGGTPSWIRLVRSGNSFTGYESNDGVTWTAVGSAAVAMGTTVDVGIGATGEVNGPLDKATFDQVSVDTTPTVVTAAAAAPSPVTGTTASLSVLGGDFAGESTLAYTWTATTIPAGALRPTLAVNGKNAAKNDTVTFFAAGTYTFQVTLINQAGLSNSSSVTVVVAQTLTAITVSPAWASVNRNATAQLSAAATDQFGMNVVTQPSFTWAMTAGAGSVSPSGLYTAPGSGTLATVSATAGPVSGSASVYVLSSPWLTQDVGAVTVSGAAGDDGNGTFVVLGSGSGIGSTADGFRFAYQTLSGNGSITAHLDSEQITGSFGLAGLMIRNDLSAGASMVFMGISAGGAPQFEERTTASGVAVGFTSGVTASWVRLSRSGNTFTGYYSNDGVTWTQAGLATIAMGTTADVGIGATGEVNGALDTATFDQVSVDTTPTVVTAAAATPSPVIGTTANLSVLGGDAVVESTLTYTWAATVVPAGAPAPTFLVNGTNSAKNDTVTFQRAGNYAFTVTIKNGVGLATTSSVSLTVDQTVTAITVSPGTSSLVEGKTERFTAMAFDQFGQALGSQPAFAWSVNSGGVGGAITPAGLYTTPGPGVGSDTVQAASGSVSGTATVSVTAAPATQLVVTPQSEPPASVVAGVGFELAVTAEDPFGNVDPTFVGNVTLALASAPGGSNLGGRLSEPASSGVATFSDLTLNEAATSDTLQATSTGLNAATTDAFAVTPAAATQLVVTAQPRTSVTAGVGFALAVSAEDPFGNVDPTFVGNVTLALASAPGGSTLGGMLTEAASAGVATFSVLTLNEAATSDTLQATHTGLSAATTGPIAVTAAAATQLVVTARPQPSVTAGVGFALAVSAEDPFGNVDPTFVRNVTLAQASGPAGANLGGTLTATAAAGVALFFGLTLNKAASGETLMASSDNLSPATVSLTVGAAPATQWVVTTEPPASVTAAVGFGLSVAAEDSFGNLDQSFNGFSALAILPANGSLGGTLTAMARGGVANFSGLTLDAAGMGDTLEVSGSGLSGAATSGITVTAAPAVQLVVTAQPPSSVTAGSPFGLVVAAEDGFGNVDPTFSGSVTAALLNNPAGGTLGGPLTVPASAGVARFSGLTLNKAAIGNTLGFSSGTLSGASTSIFTVTAAPAAQLVVTAQPLTSVTAGNGFGLTVTAEDTFGNVSSSYSGTVTIAMANNPAAATLGGALSVTASSGVATFAGLVLTSAAIGDTLEATSGTLGAVTTNPFTVKAARATQLVVTAQPPSSLTAGSPFGVVVAAEDTFGNVDPTYDGTVAVALANNPGSATLIGALMAPASAGVATFTGLMLERSAVGDTLRASSGSLAAVTTSPFAVVAGAANHLAIMTEPPATVTAGAGFGLAVAAEDAFGNVDPGSSGNVTLTLASNPGGAALGDTTAVTLGAGVAMFSGLTLNKAGSGATIAVSAGGLSGATTSAIDVTAAPATQLVVTAQPPSSVTAGSGFGLVVEAEDPFGNVDPRYSGSVLLTPANRPAGATLGGESSMTASAGVATFAGLMLDQAASGETLEASSGSLLAATTTTIDVLAAPATQWVVTVQPPSSVTAGRSFGLVVSAEDAFGNVDPSFDGNVTVALANNSADGPLGGGLTATASGGVANVAALMLDKAAVGDILQASGGTLKDAMTHEITVVAAAASQLMVTTEPPPNVTAGTGFGLAVTAEDGFGNTDATFAGSVTVTLANNPARATLGGRLTVSASAGVATFAGLTLDKAGKGAVLQVSAGSLGVMTSEITVVAGAATQLVITTEPPPNVTAGSGFGLVVSAEDAFGNVDTTFDGSVDLGSSPGSAPLGGTITATATTGVASFSDLILDQAAIGATLMASSGTLTSATTTGIAVGAAPATQLVITTEPPPNVTAGSDFSLAVSAQDAFGNVDPTFDGNVRLALSNNPADGTLGGTLTATAKAGVASFSDPILDRAASGDTLQAASGTLTVATTTDIDVSAAPAVQWVITTEPPASVTAGSGFSLVVSAEDTFGNVDPTFQGNVTVALASNPGGDTLGGTASMSADAGVAAFSGLTLEKSASAETLTVSGGLGAATTDSMAVTAAPATHLVITSAPPATVAAGIPFGLVVSAEDAFGNVDPRYDGATALTLASNPGGAMLGGITTMTAAAGVMTYSGLTLDRAAAGDVIAISSGGLGGVSTSPLAVGASPATQLVVAAQPPESVNAGSAFGLIVSAEDAFGNVAPSFSGSVTLGLANNPGGATLGGALTVSASGGIASFGGLTLDHAGGGYTLHVSSSGLSGALTSSFGVIPPSVLVESVSMQKERVGRHKPVSVIVVQFNGSVNAASAQNLGAYTLATMATSKKHPSKPVALAQSSYNASSETVTLTARKALVASPPLQLKIRTSALTDTLGRPLAGSSDGEVVATLSKAGVSVSRAMVGGWISPGRTPSRFPAKGG